MVSKVLNEKGKVSLSVANKHIASLRCWSLSHRWLGRGRWRAVVFPLQASAATTGDRSGPALCTVPSSLPILGAATSIFLCLGFHFGNSGLLTDLIKSDQDELEFPVGQTILILCNSYVCDRNLSNLHWGGSQAVLERNLCFLREEVCL